MWTCFGGVDLWGGKKNTSLTAKRSKADRQSLLQKSKGLSSAVGHGRYEIGSH